MRRHVRADSRCAAGSRQVLAWASLVVLLPFLASGCGAGCSDVKYSSRIVVRLAPQLIGSASTAGIEVCQSDDCAEVSLPAAKPTLDISLSEFDGSFDLNDNGTIEVVVSRASSVLAEARESFDFDPWEPEGSGCGTYSEHVIEVA